MTLQTYYYNYGSSTHQNNRRIEFVRTNGNDPQSIQSIAFALINGNWQQTSVIPGNRINVEGMSTTDKVNETIQARSSNRAPVIKPDKLLKDFSIPQQNNILQTLNGNRRIEVMSAPGQICEIVTSLNIFDPT